MTVVSVCFAETSRSMLEQAAKGAKGWWHI